MEYLEYRKNIQNDKSHLKNRISGRGIVIGGEGQTTTTTKKKRNTSCLNIQLYFSTKQIILKRNRKSRGDSLCFIILVLCSFIILINIFAFKKKKLYTTEKVIHLWLEQIFNLFYELWQFSFFLLSLEKKTQRIFLGNRKKLK